MPHSGLAALALANPVERVVGSARTTWPSPWLAMKCNIQSSPPSPTTPRHTRPLLLSRSGRTPTVRRRRVRSARATRLQLAWLGGPGSLGRMYLRGYPFVGKRATLAVEPNGQQGAVLACAIKQCLRDKHDLGMTQLHEAVKAGLNGPIVFTDSTTESVYRRRDGQIWRRNRIAAFDGVKAVLRIDEQPNLRIALS